MTRPALLAVLVLVLSVLAVSTGGVARAASGGVVISQVFTGGGNSGAPYANDFVELLNPGSSAVDLSSWTVQYATAAGTSWQTVALAGSIAAGHYYLVQLASGGATGAPLPTPDATGGINLASSGGKIALVRSATALTCGATAGSCAGASTIADFIGYGTATDYEGAAAAPALDNTHSAVRAAAGCTDTRDNAADFSTAAPAPRTSSSPGASCGGSTVTSTAGATASVALDVQSALSVALDHPALSFGSAVAGATPTRLAEHVTVVSNVPTGYALSVHRSAFTPTDLPLGLAAVAPAGATLGALLAGGALAPIPIAPASDLLVGTSQSATPAAGDVWNTELGFTGSLPSVVPGHYVASVVFTAVSQ
ncbi:MAG TPA: lamin tail domain-containing protein [Gaiellaceae bacterium]